MERIAMSTIVGKTMTALMIGAVLAVVPVVAASARADELEATYWMMISDRTDPEAFENYLKRFPEGDHAAEAQARLQQMGGTTAGPAPAPTDQVATPAMPSTGDQISASSSQTATPGQDGQPGQSNARQAEALFEKAMTAYNFGNKERAFTLYRQAADAGSGDAHFQLATMLDQGDGVPTDSVAAVDEYVAAGRLGVMDGYRSAVFVQDYEQSKVFNPEAAASLLLEYAKADPAGAVDALDNLGPQTLIPVQTELAAAGYYTSAIDGLTGPGTRAALEAYGRDGAAAMVVQAADDGVPPLVVHHKGVGALTMTTSFDADVVRAALPGYTVKAKRISAEGMSETLLQVFRNDELMLRIVGEQTIYTIDAYGNGIADETGMTIGRSTFADYRGSVEDNCWVLEEEGNSGAVSCYSPDPAITYFFRINHAVFPDTDGNLHRASVPSAAKLDRMLWYPTD